MAENETRNRQVARNQSLFREAGERLEPRGGTSPAALIEFVCECGDEACGEHVLLAVEEYAFLRRFATRFAVRPDHVCMDSERIIAEEPDRFAIVE